MALCISRALRMSASKPDGRSRSSEPFRDVFSPPGLDDKPHTSLPVVIEDEVLMLLHCKPADRKPTAFTACVVHQSISPPGLTIAWLYQPGALQSRQALAWNLEIA